MRDASESRLRRIALSSPYGEALTGQPGSWAAEAAERGHAVSTGEWDEGLTALAVPVTAGTGRVVAPLSLSGPSHRFPHEAVERFAADLAEAARLISDQGFDHPLGSAGRPSRRQGRTAVPMMCRVFGTYGANE
ncbi:IclR family transcriptional regulator C-terminal domain-containing protein [Streptomyces sp. NPDC051133]|uniref:IclR family transcriptional regulator domain-containing protein n=1 Tax=Streptomyces sp. NPDC051133 TaxID=3155521 RepID=UPI003446BFA9